MKHKQSLTTVVTLGNAAELVARVAEKVMGTEVAKTFSGQELNNQAVQRLAVSSMQKNIIKKTFGE